MGASVLVLLMPVSGCAGTRAADAAGIPDDVMLTTADFGAQPSDGRPDPAVHPLPPKPCDTRRAPRFPAPARAARRPW